MCLNQYRNTERKGINLEIFKIILFHFIVMCTNENKLLKKKIQRFGNIGPSLAS